MLYALAYVRQAQQKLKYEAVLEQYMLASPAAGAVPHTKSAFNTIMNLLVQSSCNLLQYRSPKCHQLPVAWTWFTD